MAKELLKPPADVPAARLFQLLLAAPRAKLPVSLDFVDAGGAERGAFFVHALRPFEEAEAYYAAERAAPEARPDVIAACLAAAALHDATGEPVFGSGDELRSLLREDVAERVLAEVLRALAVISPSLRRIDERAWVERLAAGARDVTNVAQAVALGSCTCGEERIYEGGKAKLARIVVAPDRYYGVPVAHLTDGQWLAFRAARRVMLENLNG